MMRWEGRRVGGRGGRNEGRKERRKAGALPLTPPKGDALRNPFVLGSGIRGVSARARWGITLRGSALGLVDGAAMNAPARVDTRVRWRKAETDLRSVLLGLRF
jgi:hypothetical protein